MCEEYSMCECESCECEMGSEQSISIDFGDGLVLFFCSEDCIFDSYLSSIQRQFANDLKHPELLPIADKLYDSFELLLRIQRGEYDAKKQKDIEALEHLKKTLQ